MAKNLLSDILQQVRNDPDRRSYLPHTTAKIWHAPRLAAGGSPAIGFQPYRETGPVVQAVSLKNYEKFNREFMRQGGEFWIDPSIVAPTSFGAGFDDLEKFVNLNEQISRVTEAEIDFARRHVRTFTVLFDGITRIDYNTNADEWDVITIGDFNEASYCFLKPSAGAASIEKSVAPSGISKHQVQTPIEALTTAEKIARLRNFNVAPNEACPENFVRADGQNMPVRFRYPEKGDTWVGGIVQNAREERSEFYRSINHNSVYMSVGKTGNITMSAPIIHFDIDPRAMSFGDYAENPVQIFGPSNAVTPVPRFRSRVSQLNFISGVYNAIRALLDDIQSQSSFYSSEVTFEHQVIDYNSFIPPGVQVEERS